MQNIDVKARHSFSAPRGRGLPVNEAWKKEILNMLKPNDAANVGVLLPFGEIDPAKTIYRYMNVERYFDLIEKKVNSLSHITVWEDPYEGCVFRALADLCDRNGQSDAVLSLYDRFKYYYGQCWTTNDDESDVMWRAQGTRGTVVRVGTKIGKLLKSMSNVGCCSRGGILSAGKVEYAKTTEEFDEWLRQGVVEKIVSPRPEEHLRMFYMKRKEFELEQEFRVIVEADEGLLDRDTDTDGRWLKYEINPQEMIDDVLVDPCMSRREYEQLICRTRHRYDFPVMQSDLFKWPTVSIPIAKVKDNPNERFWTLLKGRYGDAVPNLNNHKIPKRRYWQISHRDGVFIFFVFNGQGARLEYYIDNSDRLLNVAVFHSLMAHKKEIELELGQLVWCENVNSRARKIFKVCDADVAMDRENTWNNAVSWFCENGPHFVEILDRYCT